MRGPSSGKGGYVYNPRPVLPPRELLVGSILREAFDRNYFPPDVSDVKAKVLIRAGIHAAVKQHQQQLAALSNEVGKILECISNVDAI